jgi:hypothetical protein
MNQHLNADFSGMRIAFKPARPAGHIAARADAVMCGCPISIFNAPRIAFVDFRPLIHNWMLAQRQNEDVLCGRRASLLYKTRPIRCADQVKSRALNVASSRRRTCQTSVLVPGPIRIQWECAYCPIPRTLSTSQTPC